MPVVSELQPYAASEVRNGDVIEIGGEPGRAYVVLAYHSRAPRLGEDERQVELFVEPVGGGARRTHSGGAGQTVYVAREVRRG
jgi:hypothetical protein